jgi:hypothetical protein
MHAPRMVSAHLWPTVGPRPWARVWRIATFVAILGNVAFNYIADRLPVGVRSIKDVSRAHPSLFSPADFTFSIWGLIFGTLLVYGAAQTLERHEASPTLDRLTKPMVLANILMAAWVVAFKSELLTSALLLLSAVWMLSVAMLAEVHGGMRQERGAGAWHVPISLLSGWVTVALLASMSMALEHAGWLRGSRALVPIAVVMVGYAAFIATMLSAEFVDPVIPLVVAWGMAGLYFAQVNVAPLVALSAFIVGSGLAVWGVLLLILRLTRDAKSLFAERRRSPT